MSKPATTAARFAYLIALLLASPALPAIGGASCQAKPLPPVAISDYFSRYTGGDPGAVWDAGVGGWTVRSGVMESDGIGGSTAAPRRFPMGRDLVVEATITPHRATTGGWSSAGIRVWRDDSNYWELILGQRPDDQGRIAGQWLPAARAGRR